MHRVLATSLLAIACSGPAEMHDAGREGVDACTTAQTYYRDDDMDGLGVDIESVQACAQPAGYASVGGDCDDAAAGNGLGTIRNCISCGDACQFACAPTACTATTSLATSGTHTCALDDAGSLYCWGFNVRGALGDGTTLDASRPRRAIVVTQPLQQIAAGNYYTCGHDGTQVLCFGSNEMGMLGANGMNPSGTPVFPLPLSAPTPVAHLAAGAAVLAILGDAHELWCWGRGDLCLTGPAPTTAVRVGAAPANLIDADASSQHACVVTMTGNVSCWGANANGEAGQPTAMRTVAAPAQVAGLTNVVQIAVDYAHSCALRDGGTVACWGQNPNGELGDGSVVHEQCGTCPGSPLTCYDCSSTPVDVDGIAGAVEIDSTCARLGDGSVWCWGDGAHTAAQIDLRAPAIGLARGQGTHCAIHEGGRLSCWGQNTNGQAGNGTNVSPADPSPVLTPQ